MKKLILLLFIPLFFACSSDDSSDDNTNPTDDTNPVYLDANGVTIKARDWAVVGDSGVINGVTYTIVDGATLRTMIDNGDDVTRACTSRITNMSNLQLDNTFTQDIKSWDVSNVTNMQQMFNGAENFNHNISSWDVSSVINMTQMFRVALSFNQDISNWDVSNVQQMTAMFSVAESFNQDLSSWDVTNVTSLCNDFCIGATNWTLPKPNFTDDCYLGCD